MLEMSGVETYYGESQALFGVDLTIKPSQVVTLLGRNGMGKSTTIRSLMGMNPARKGKIIYSGQQIEKLPSYKIARLGLGLVPEGRQIFPNLTVKENIIATASNYSGSADPYDLDHVLGIFPRLKERLNHFGNQLSGGEQQMLAVVRALMINPRLLILDEATEGLAPLARDEIWHGLGILKSKGLAILIVDKNLDSLMKLADHHYIIEKGKCVWNGTSDELKSQPDLATKFLGI
ncbi:MAG: ABC transporter ATP-binding protein [Desulfotalea sp.]